MYSKNTLPMHKVVTRDLTKKLSWTLTLFFLLKGLLWLAIPFLSAVYTVGDF